MCDKEIDNSEKNIVYGVDCDTLLREALDLGEQEAFQKFLEVISLYINMIISKKMKKNAT